MSSTEGSVDSSCVSGDRSRHRQEAASTETSSDPASSTGIVPVPQPPLVDESDPLSSHYGDLAFWCLKEKVLAKKVDIASLETVLDGAVISLRARLHSKTFGRNNRLNLVLRKQFHKVTCRLWAEHSGVSEAMVKYGRTLTNDSVLEIEGEVKVSRLEEGSISIKKEIEIYIKKIYCLSRAKSLPFNLDDASAPEVAAEVNPRPRVSQPTRLNHRIVDLRTPANQAIFIIQSRVEQLLRQFLLSEGFVGIHTPKILAGASDGGASVFTLRYKEMDASLAQSAQLHKQMAICSDFKRVFEAAASFRAESSKTNRHLCEFIQFVVEMEIEETYLEVINLVDRLFVHVFNELNHSCRDLIEIVDKQHCGRRFKYLDKTPCISFQRAVEMLKDAGLDINPFGDLNRESERKLGELMLKEYDTDFFIVDRFPLVVRPFFTMACPYDKNYSNSLNVFMRGRRKEIKEMKIIKMYKEIQFPYIPEEIILLILSKLPVKSLLRFRCVSKSWLSLISDPKFTLATQRRQVIVLPEYNRMSMAHHSYRTGYYPDYYRPKFSIKLINDEASVKQLPEPEPLRMIRSKLQCLVRMRGSCNGLLLVSVCEDLFLWNPSTRSCNLVLSHYHLSEAKQEYLDLTVSGLCYDSSTDDYKALMAICDVDNSITDVVVGSLRNKTWTQIHFPYDKYGVESGPLVNEHLHWLVSDSSCTSEDHHRFFTSALVVYFDKFTNEFVKVPMPPQLEEERINVQYTILGLGILDRCLSMALSRKELGGKHDLEVLTMKKYGEKTSWTSLFNISDYFRGFDIDEYHLVPLCFTKIRDDDDNVVLMFLKEDESLLTCNPKQNSCSDFYIPNRSISINAAMFVESLVSPSTYMWEDEEYMEIFLSRETIKWKRNKDMKIKYDLP